MTHRRLIPVHEQVIGRSIEVKSIRSSFRKAKESCSQFIFLQGQSGTGKSHLAKHMLTTTTSPKLCHVHAKFDEGQQVYPFEVFMSTLSDLCQNLDDCLKEDVALDLRNNISSAEREVLELFVPNLGRIFCLGGEQQATQREPRQVCELTDQKDLMPKLRYSLKQLLKSICAKSTELIVICLDDIQWADSATLDMLHRVTTDVKQNLAVLSTFRLSTAPIDDWMAGAGLEDKITLIPLSGLSLSNINDLVSKMTDLSQTETLDLAEIVLKRTDGNVFFAIQLMEYLCNEEKISFCPHIFQWQWDIQAVRDATELSNNVVNVVSSRIGKHPDNVCGVLKLAGCLGFRLDPSILHVVRDIVPEITDVDGGIEYCVQERLVERAHDGRLRFMHDRILQAATALFADDERSKVSFQVGLRLKKLVDTEWKDDSEYKDRVLFLCADQLRHGATHIKEPEHKVMLAQLNYEVGQKAVRKSVFAVAAQYFEEGIHFLDGINKWGRWYDLSLGLLSSWAESEYYMGNFEASEKAFKEILDHARCQDDTIRARLTQLERLRAQFKLAESISASLKLLELMGVKINKNPNFLETRIEYKRMLSQLHSNSDQKFLNLPILKDPKEIAASQIMTGMLIHLHMQGLHALCIVVISKLVGFTLKFGVCGKSPEAFSMAGAFLISYKGDIKAGSRFGDLSVDLCIKLKELSSAGSLGTPYYCCKHWQSTPLSKCLNPLFSAYTTGMRSGDTYTAFMYLTGYFQLYFYSGLNLRPLLRDIEEFAPQLLQFGQKTAYLNALPVWQAILNLSGFAENPLDLMGGKAMATQHLAGNDIKMGHEACSSLLMQIAFYLGNLKLASTLSAKVQSFDAGLGKAYPMYPARVFCFGAIAIANARETGKKKYRVEAWKHIETIKGWTSKGSMNCLHKLLILEAEYAALSANGNEIQRVKMLYDKAVALASKAGFQQDAALCKQLCGEFLHRNSEWYEYAGDYIRDSKKRWQQWGAFAVADALNERYAEYFVIELGSDCDEGALLSVRRFDKRVSDVFHRQICFD